MTLYMMSSWTLLDFVVLFMQMRFHQVHYITAKYQRDDDSDTTLYGFTNSSVNLSTGIWKNDAGSLMVSRILRGIVSNRHRQR
jgi:hypothetical protein